MPPVEPKIPPTPTGPLYFEGEREPAPLWSHYWQAIVAAGAAYPAIVASLLLAVGLVVPLPGWTSQSVGELLILTAIALTVGTLTGGIYAGMVALPTLAVTGLLLTLLRINLPLVTLGSFYGGLTGFLCTSPVAVFALDSLLFNQGGYGPSAGEAVLGLALGPMLAIHGGQIAGAYAGIQLGLLIDQGGRPVYGSPPTRFSFGLRQLLGLTLVASVLLTGLRLAGLLLPAVGLAIGFYLLWQTFSRYPAEAIARWMLRRHIALAAESTRPGDPHLDAAASASRTPPHG